MIARVSWFGEAQVMTKSLFCRLSCEVDDYGVWERWQDLRRQAATQHKAKASCIPLIKTNRQQLPGISHEMVNNHIASNNNNSNKRQSSPWGARPLDVALGHILWDVSGCQERYWTYLTSSGHFFFPFSFFFTAGLLNIPIWRCWLKATALSLKVN